MQYYCAPLEGITGHMFRTVHHRYFPGVDKYFTPFLTPTQEHVFPKKILQEIAPENNRSFRVVPQILTRRSEDFIWMARELADRGYREINLNLGCPSGTVTAKGKGSGFLAHPDELDRFLDDIYSALDMDLSIKTRLGSLSSDEFPDLLEIFSRYPVSELIIHPRVRTDFYRNQVQTDVFAWALDHWDGPICYNGDLTTVSGCAALSRRFPTVERVMLGRGLIADPALCTKLTGGPAADKTTLRAFHDELFESYSAAFGSRRNAMMRMKELWFYLIHLFSGGGDCLKALRKAKDPLDYTHQVEVLFRTLDLLPDAQVDW